MEQFSVLDHVPMGICVIREDYRVLFWNVCLENWTGIDKNKIITEKLGTFFPHIDEPRYRSRIDTIIHGGPPAIFSSQLHKHIFPSPLPNNKYRIQHTTVSGIPSFDDRNYYALFAVEDVTDLSIRLHDYRIMRNQALEEVKQREQTEEKLRKANQKILEHQKAVVKEERLNTLLQMAGATAHELNQPLMILMGNVEMINLEFEDPKKLKKRLNSIEDAAKRITEAVKKIQQIQRYQIKSHDKDTFIIDLEGAIDT